VKLFLNLELSRLRKGRKCTFGLDERQDEAWAARGGTSLVSWRSRDFLSNVKT